MSPCGRIPIHGGPAAIGEPRAIASELFANAPGQIGRGPQNGLPFFDYDPAYRLLVDIESLAEQDLLSFDLGRDGLMTMLPVGRARGLKPSLGDELKVYWICGYGGGILLPYTDTTSGHETFGGGSYLPDSINGANLGMENGRWILDFNFAFNPSCACSPERICPLASSENHLPGAIRAGERWAIVETRLKRRA